MLMYVGVKKKTASKKMVASGISQQKRLKLSYKYGLCMCLPYWGGYIDELTLLITAKVSFTKINGYRILAYMRFQNISLDLNEIAKKWKQQKSFEKNTSFQQLRHKWKKNPIVSG